MESAASLFKMGESDLRALFIASVTRFAVLPAIGVVGFIRETGELAVVPGAHPKELALRGAHDDLHAVWRRTWCS